MSLKLDRLPDQLFEPGATLDQLLRILDYVTRDGAVVTATCPVNPEHRPGSEGSAVSARRLGPRT